MLDKLDLLSSLEALDVRIGTFDGNDAARTAILIELRRILNMLPEVPSLQVDFNAFKSDLELFGLSLKIAGGTQPQASALLQQSWEKLRGMITKRTLH